MLNKGVALISGVPRSGTSWIGELVNSSPEVCYRFQPYFSYAFKNFVDHDSGRERYEQFFRGLIESNDEFLLRSDMRRDKSYPEFNKNAEPSMLVMKEARYMYLFSKLFRLFPDFRKICIIRNPCAVVNSWLRSPKEFPATADVGKEWRFGACKNEGREEDFYGFYKWRETTHMYLDLKDKFPDRVLIVKYEQLVADTLAESERIFRFLGLEFSEQSKQFVDSSNLTHQEGPYAVFKDKSVKDKWRSELHPEIIDEITYELSGTRLEQFLL